MFYSNQFTGFIPVPPLEIFPTKEVSKPRFVELGLTLNICRRCSLLFKIGNPRVGVKLPVHKAGQGARSGQWRKDL